MTIYRDLIELIVKLTYRRFIDPQNEFGGIPFYIDVLSEPLLEHPQIFVYALRIHTNR
ncbi:hypothetical protein D3C85_1797950 [compost metagenome]